jgi:hypothetical protein
MTPMNNHRVTRLEAATLIMGTLRRQGANVALRAGAAMLVTHTLLTEATAQWRLIDEELN